MKITTCFISAIACFSCLFSSCNKEEDDLTNDFVDYSGKVYKTVVIGDQEWMAENLATRFFSNGEAIYTRQQIANLPNKSVPVYYYFEGQESYYRTYGALYNHYCVIEEGLIPNGWRIPTKNDVNKLVDYIKSRNYSFEPSDTADWVAKALSSTTIWNNNLTVGSIGYNRETNNSTGFNALPGGYISDNDMSYGEKNSLRFWTTTVDSASNSLLIATLQVASKDLIFTTLEETKGACYIRCVRDL